MACDDGIAMSWSMWIFYTVLLKNWRWMAL